MNARTWISPGIVAGLGIAALLSLGGRPTGGAVSIGAPEQVAVETDQIVDDVVTDLAATDTATGSDTVMSLICCEDVMGACIPYDSRKCPSGSAVVDCPCVSESSDTDDAVTR